MTEQSTLQETLDMEIPDGHGLMHTLDKTGDSRLMWDRSVPDEVDAARRQFDDLTGKGYIAYEAEGKQGERGKVMKKFDKNVERIILVKQLVGG